jgi:SPP1 family predicted phage head-tail adaptor
MNIGRLNSRCTLQQPNTAQDALGQPVPGWVDVAQVWADIRYQSGVSAIKAGADVSVVNVSVRIRYRGGVNSGMRVAHGATVMDVQAVLPHGREWLDLVCEVAA